MLSKQKSSRTPLRKKSGSKLPCWHSGQTWMISTKVDRLCSRLNTKVSTNKTSMLYPLWFVSNQILHWKLTTADTAERLTLNCTDLSWDKHPCLLHGWAVSHLVKQASSQRRKRHHRGGIRFHPNSISAQILQHKVERFFLPRPRWQTPEVVLTGDILGLLSTARPAKVRDPQLGKLAGMSGLCIAHRCHAYSRKEGRDGLKAHKAYSHIFHWYQSHMAGFHEIVEAVHCFWQCLIEALHTNVDEQTGCVLWWWCTVYYDEKIYSVVRCL